ncbi:MAG: hypothetical protein CENE_03737 [Candidatus Celerinatantimonas neptuna]|nr:MAG: hypothetical protein CENE_03737 [Candidatus Celerinatantimonas neptuna]
MRSRWYQGIAVLVGLSFDFSSYASEILQVPVTVTDHQCEPMNLTVPAGKVRFVIKNKSMRALEWEILKGVRVVAERENIAPGFYQKMTVELDPGQYETTCGLLTNPHGILTVTARPGHPRYRLKLADIIAISSEYKFFLVSQSRHLVQQLQKAPGGDLPKDLISDYYHVWALIPAYRQVDTYDWLQKGVLHRPTLEMQTTRWKQAIRRQSLSVTQLIGQLRARLNTRGLPQKKWRAVIFDVKKLVELSRPVLLKLEPDWVNLLEQHLSAAALTQPEVNIRQQFDHDLTKLAGLLTLQEK